MPEGRVLSRIWAFSIQTLWTVLYTWYRFDYYENATVFGRILNRLGAFLSIPMERAVSFYEAVCRRFMVRMPQGSAIRYLSAIWEKNTWKRQWFDEMVYLPFENRRIPARQAMMDG